MSSGLGVKIPLNLYTLDQHNFIAKKISQGAVDAIQDLVD